MFEYLFLSVTNKTIFTKLYPLFLKQIRNKEYNAKNSSNEDVYHSYKKLKHYIKIKDFTFFPLVCHLLVTPSFQEQDSHTFYTVPSFSPSIHFLTAFLSFLSFSLSLKLSFNSWFHHSRNKNLLKFHHFHLQNISCTKEWNHLCEFVRYLVSCVMV